MSNTLPHLIAAARPTLIDGATGDVVPAELLAARVRHVARVLAARGFGPGDVLALWAPDIPPWAGVALGAMAAGGAVTGIHPTATDREVAAQLDAAQASVLVTTPALVPRAPAADVLAIGPELLSLATAPDDPSPPSPDALALVPFSSGTTGVPKPVRLTHRNLVAAARQIELALGLSPDDVVLALPPFCHVMGFVVTLAAPLAAGATVITAPSFDLELIERQHVTVLVVPPPLMAKLARVDHPLPSLRLIVSGGAPLGADLQRAVAARFPHASVAQGYGMTETAATIAGPTGGGPTPPGSVGRPMPGTQVKLVDGELWVRGPQVMQPGWLRTGDLARQDADGNLTIVDRIKDLIKVNGFQVAPAELEALLLTHPEVSDAGVVGRPDERCGERPVAFVVGEVDDLDDWLATRLAPYKRPAQIVRVDAIPRTPSGKIMRRALAARLRPAAPTPSR